MEEDGAVRGVTWCGASWQPRLRSTLAFLSAVTTAAACTSTLATVQQPAPSTAAAPARAPTGPTAPAASMAPSATVSAPQPSASGAAAPVATEALAASAAPCADGAAPRTIDVEVYYSEKKGDSRNPPELIARVRAPGTKLSVELWRGAMPTGCAAEVEGESMRLECHSDLSSLLARVRIVGDELVVESRRGNELMLAPVPVGSAPPPASSERALARVAAVPVGCGAKARFHPRARDVR